MTDVTAAEFRSAFSEFDALADAAVESLIARAYRLMEAGPRAALACAAHLAALDADATGQPDGGSGEVLSELEGPKNTTYRTMAEVGRETWFTQTKYGREAYTLERRSPRSQFGTVVG